MSMNDGCLDPVRVHTPLPGLLCQENDLTEEEKVRREEVVEEGEKEKTGNGENNPLHREIVRSLTNALRVSSVL